MLKFLKLETLRESGSLRARVVVLYAALLARKQRRGSIPFNP